MRGVIDANSLVATVAITAEGHERAYATDRNDAVVRALSGAIREAGERPHPKLKTGTADLNVVGPVWQCPIAAYGPGDSALDHTPGEHLVIDEYLRAIGVLTRAVESLASELVADS
jgi:LysW-gamma-L-lysine carboxypeptidase